MGQCTLRHTFLHFGIAAMALASASPATAANAPEPTWCARVFSLLRPASVVANIVDSVEFLPAGATPEDLTRAYRALQESRKATRRADIDAQRLVNIEDWKKALSDGNSSPWKTYGRQTIADWLSGLRFINSNADNQPLSVDLLQEIHRRANRHLPFHGFEGRRIRKLYDEGKITKDQFRVLLDQAFKQNREISGVPHSSLRGTFRQDPIDQIVHRGSSRTPDGSRYFSHSELEALRANPLVKVDEASIVKIADNHYEGNAFYHDVKTIESSVRLVLSRADAQLKAAQTPEEKIRIIIQMQKDLVSIHPFLDGNGRTIRLLGDLLYQRNGLPPPLYPNEEDLTMTANEAYEFTRHGMIDYLNAWTGKIKSRVGTETKHEEAVP